MSDVNLLVGTLFLALCWAVLATSIAFSLHYRRRSVWSDAYWCGHTAGWGRGIEFVNEKRTPLFCLLDGMGDVQHDTYGLCRSCYYATAGNMSVAERARAEWERHHGKIEA